ncbi:MAG: hypothetical protein BWX71_02168 [Deltaproteobacteria bacterium ADurb.Bin072]|nr:MAG: hypothetical protein BWX71_02168 [Deltaproteobacteria bacterium ADurb.Bin072]
MMARMMCSIMKMVTPLSRIFLTSSRVSSTSLGRRPAMLSSMRNISGSVAMARAISRRLRSAMVRLPARTLHLLPRLNLLRTSMALSSASDGFAVLMKDPTMAL